MRPRHLVLSIAVALLVFGRSSFAAPPAPGSLHLVPQVGPEESVTSVAVSPDGGLLAVGSFDGRIRIHERRTGKLLRVTGTDSCRGVRTLAFAPDGKSLASGGLEMDSTVKVWDPQTGTLLRTLAGHVATAPGGLYAEVYALAYSPNGKLLATAGRDKLVLIWDLETGKP